MTVNGLLQNTSKYSPILQATFGLERKVCASIKKAKSHKLITQISLVIARFIHTFRLITVKLR